MSDSNDFINPTDDVESEEDSLLAAPQLLTGVVVTDTDWTAETVLSQIEKGNILLNPRFQRREAWEDKRKSRFIESLIMGLPIPQLVLAEVKGSRGKFVVIDGKQRLLALARFASPGAAENQFRLKGLDIRSDLNGLNWDDIKADSRFHFDVAAFENAQIRTTIVKGWNDEKVLYLIFHRLNSGSVPLSPQELRHVLHPGDFIDFAFDFAGASSVLISVLGNNGKPDFRMRDVELLIRFIGYQLFLNTYEGDLKAFLDRTVNILNTSWPKEESSVRLIAETCIEAISFTVKIFGEQNAFSKWTSKGPERRFNRAVFDVMTYFFADPIVRKLVTDQKKEADVLSAFSQLCTTNTRFVRALETTTKSKEAVVTRLWLWGKELEKELGAPMEKMQRLSAQATQYGIQ